MRDIKIIRAFNGDKEIFMLSRGFNGFFVEVRGDIIRYVNDKTARKMVRAAMRAGLDVQAWN